MKLAVLFLAGIMLTLLSVSAQNTLNNKKRELENLRQSIQSAQLKLDRLQREESKARASLNTYQKQRHRITVFIREIEEQLARLQDSAQVLRAQIQSTQQALSDAEASYNRTAQRIATYHARHKGDVSHQSSVDPVFRALTESLSSYRADMLSLRDSLLHQEDLLAAYSATQDSVLSVREREERQLSSTISKSSRQLAAIRTNKQQVQAELRKKQQSARKLRALINSLVAEARRKAEAERRKAQAKRNQNLSAKPPSTTPQATETVKGFPANSLPWPTTSRKILHGYGNYRNPQTGTTLDNPGIDIATPVGSTVKSVAAGEVSSVTWLPGFGSLVILDHGNGVRTVYANLATVRVGKGASVGAGSVLGTSGENIDGALMHFEVWNGKSRQNPMTYLR